MHHSRLRSWFLEAVPGVPVLLLGALSATPIAAQVYSDQAASTGMVFTQHVPSDFLHVGSGGAFGDFDGDGDLDIYLADRVGPNALFENTGVTGFQDRAVAFGVDDPAGESTGALFGDYDNDGDADLYVLNRGDNDLFRNDGSDGNGGWLFTEVTAQAGVEAFGRSSTAAWGDVDNDGYLDLYVANHNYPLAPPQAADPRRDFLYHSVPGPNGGRVFEDWSAYCDLAAMQDAAAHSVAFLDVDLDGDLDIFVANENLSGGAPQVTGENFLWRNDGPDGAGGWLFTDDAAAAGLDWQGAPMGIAVGDYDGNGMFDLATSDFGANHLYQWAGPGQFIDVAAAAGVDRPFVPSGAIQVSWGMSFTDCDLDGYEDLYVAAGKLPGQTGQANALFLNDGNPPDNTFTDVSTASGADLDTSSRCAVTGDYDGDGDEDLLVTSLGDVAYLLRNDQTGGDFFGVDLSGTVSNRDAIGARVQVTVSSMTPAVQWHLVQSGSSTGGGQALRQTFGVTGATQVDHLDVFWPSGLTSTMTNLPINQVVHVTEPCGAWTNHYGGTPGSNGVPALTGVGPLTAGSSAVLSLGNAPPGAAVLLWISVDSNPFGVFGGTLYPNPNLVALLFVADSQGQSGLGGTIPVGLPACSRFWFQYLVQDTTTAWGITLSNAVQATTP